MLCMLWDCAFQIHHAHNTNSITYVGSARVDRYLYHYTRQSDSTTTMELACLIARLETYSIATYIDRASLKNYGTFGTFRVSNLCFVVCWQHAYVALLTTFPISTQTGFTHTPQVLLQRIQGRTNRFLKFK